MAQMKYKTRGMCNPQGLPKVYFCAHPTDRGLFDDIADSILAYQNCSVWCIGEEITDPEDHLFDLGQMQLFVMPVTTSLLTKENFALNIEFPYAIEHHIPVLPLMQEQGLEDLFNQKCGNLQFLDKNNRDATAISYENKLKTYLASVLVGDELAEKVRSAFDAYIFLSYRKKDRKHAQDLMRMIHKNEFCRDVAIWYDEFLTPGEDFNDAIRDALCKSDLFVLTVTPNLVNEVNYVMTEEYPMALREEKPTIPAEMVPTDHAQLQQKFQHIPECTRTEPDLSEALLEKLKHLAMEENDHSPEHNFLIGLAYLSGIDVEVDYERAVKLITGSAEAGLVEAIDKLVDIYRNELEFESAVVWQTKKIAALEAAVPQELHDLATNYEKLGGFYDNLEDLSQARVQYQKAAVIYEKIVQKEDSFEACRNLALCYDRFGEALKRWGDLNEAGILFHKSIEIFEQEANRSTDVLFVLATGYSKLGDVRAEQKDFCSASEYHKKACVLIEQQLQEQDFVELWCNLAVSYNRLGYICAVQEDLSGAKEQCQKSLRIYEQHLKGQAFSGLSLAISFDELGRIFEKNDDTNSAQEFYRKSLEIIVPPYREETPEQQHLLALSFDRLGDVWRDRGYLCSAMVYYRSTLEIFEQASKKTPTAEVRRNVAVSCVKIGKVLIEQKDFSRAKEYIQKALQLFKQLTKENDALQACCDLAACYNNLSVIMVGQEKLQDGRRYLEKQIGILEQLAKTDDSVEMRCKLAACYKNLILLLMKQKDTANAMRYHNKLLLICERLAKENNNIQVQGVLADCYCVLGSYLRSRGGLYDQMISYFEKSLEFTRQLEVENNTSEANLQLAEAYYVLSTVELRYDKSTYYIRQAITIMETLCHRFPNDTSYQRKLKKYKLCQSTIPATY